MQKALLTSSLVLLFLVGLPFLSASQNDSFYKENGTIHCENAEIGETGTVGGTEYTAVNESMLRDMADEYESNNLSHVCTSHVENMSQMFYGASSFNQNIGNWNTRNVEDMRGMFAYTDSFNQDIHDWDTSNVEDMDGMFYFASSFNQDIGGWNTSNVEDMSWMFYFASSFNQDIGGWNTSNVKYMRGMFEVSFSFNQDLSNWDVDQVQDYEDYDEGASSWQDEYKPDFPSPLLRWLWTGALIVLAVAAIFVFWRKHHHSK